jgi:bacterioferritin
LRFALITHERHVEAVRDRSVFLEEHARKIFFEEEQHLGEVNRMLRKPGEIARFRDA